ncbi:putative pre-mRNA-splicing factor ATP-dependent RNA helicase DHX32 isoform X2 [Melanerpes formicivorus]|uniref:putative pre-mRNA-splicing factor ATP-dependent RNA helicase DHX32 isoform X2 n=1 Tax=Melanerpes formicivorus TaxID=211600 RepID=UPI00358E9C91
MEVSTFSPEIHCFSELLDGSDGDEEILVCGEDLELNPFDGLPYSSRYYKLMKEREELPVWKEKHTFMESLLHNQIVIVSGDAKTGKSSQVPQWCAEYCLSMHYQHGVVVCTQVHKQTAVWLALHVADEMDVNVGHEVGYFTPFESCCTTETILRYCTDDMLQREMMSTPLLTYYGVIILDDVHERTIATDALLGLLKNVLILRPELRLVILTAPHMSGTLLNYYGSIPFIRVENKHHAEVVYSCSIQNNHFLSALRLLFEIHHTKEKGNIVIFLACEQDIENAYQMIRQEQSNLNPDLGELIPVPLYPTKRELIPKANQDKQKCCKKYRRKVLLTTSSGESLIWIKNVTFVIDVGVERRKVYNPRIRADSVITQPISKSQAEMHKQILGVSSSGKLFCLYPEEFTYKEMKEHLPAKIQESNLTSMVLFLKRMDIAGFGHCDFLTRPAPNCFLHSPPGTEEIALTCWRKFSHPAGDHFTLINIFNAFKEATANSANQYYSNEKWCRHYFLSCSALKMAEIIRAELVEIMKRIELPVSEPHFGSKENTLNIKKALLSGYFMHIARDVDGSGNYLMLTHRQVAQLHPFSSYYNTRRIPEWVLFHEFNIAEDNSIRVVTEISPDLFMELVPQYYFSNLPPSENKDILQEVINHLSPVSSMKEKQKTSNDNKEKDKLAQTPTEQRCIVQ